jgi:MFS family permease
MPKECLDCRFVTVNDEALQCDRCGGERLRFSMLAGMKFREQKAEAARTKIGDDDRPSTLERARLAVVYLLASQVAAFILLGAAVFSTPNDEVPKDQSFEQLLTTIGELYPAATLVGAVALPALAAGVGVVFALRGVYLAQQMGLALGPVAALVSLAAFEALGGATPIPAWLFAPILASGISFFAGLRMTGFIRASGDEAKTIEYKPIDSWDREAKAKYSVLRVARQGHYKKLTVGLTAGAVSSYLFPFLLSALSGATPGELRVANAVFGWTGVCIAGGFAAAGTSAPFLQGALAGVLMYFVRHYAHFHVITPESMFQAWLHVAAGIAGGVAGRTFFPPPRVVRGRQRCISDGVVYVGDELVKSSA